MNEDIGSHDARQAGRQAIPTMMGDVYVGQYDTPRVFDFIILVFSSSKLELQSKSCNWERQIEYIFSINVKVENDGRQWDVAASCMSILQIVHWIKVHKW